ncbi:putative disease resistance protein rga1 [Phtheirospermum japonicum]|uniref:Putative disease resistance protein rga1 n=1 Tax=Phtheirospermum japonicum TaxID=374723 RepID=A0A830C8U4_9LAMI|nr:putative disease resistance protein rga1 [Phtheirospermum japonicum]
MKIESVKAKLDGILEDKNKYGLEASSPPPTDDPSSRRVQSTSFVDMAEVQGRDIDRDVVASKILTATGDHQPMEIVSIVGVGGVGKTTLAQSVFNDDRVNDCFELKIWICVSDPFDEVGIAKKIVEGVTGKSPDSTQLQVLQQSIIKCISGKKFLLVLDDVWTEDRAKWEPLKIALKSCGMGSKVLVTTRNEKVAEMLDTLENEIHRLGVLSDEACWLLLQRIALYGRSEEDCAKYKDIGMQIVGKCRGLPLAAKTLGGLLRRKNNLEEWENVLNSETWELKEVIEVELFPHLLIGSDGGNMEPKGRQYFDNLAMRSLFQDFEKDENDGKQIMSFKLHDIVHDFAQYLRNNGVETKTGCQVCSLQLVSQVKEYRSCLNWNTDSPVCDCLVSLRVLNLKGSGIPKGIEKFIHLRWLDLSHNRNNFEGLETICSKLYNLQTLFLQYCDLQEIPKEIGNLINLRHFDLSHNESLKELPESICDFRKLQTLNIECCDSISSLPQRIHDLKNLKHLHNCITDSIKQFPQGLSHLTCLCTLSEFRVGKNVGRLGWLKNLNRLSGSLKLRITLNGGLENTDVEDAREGELRNKEDLQELYISFDAEMGEVEDRMRVDVIDALQPHPNLKKLSISCFKGSRLPDWIALPNNQVKYIRLHELKHLSSLPPLGILPCLEEIEIDRIREMRFVGRKFLGMTTTTESGHTDSITDAYFPKLKKLKLECCSKWEEWEDITDQQEDEKVSFMPHLTSLSIKKCDRLAALPHRLLRKAAALEKLDISGSTQLKQHYGDKEGSSWKSISNINPRIQLTMSD